MSGKKNLQIFAHLLKLHLKKKQKHIVASPQVHCKVIDCSFCASIIENMLHTKCMTESVSFLLISWAFNSPLISDFTVSLQPICQDTAAYYLFIYFLPRSAKAAQWTNCFIKWDILRVLTFGPRKQYAGIICKWKKNKNICLMSLGKLNSRNFNCSVKREGVHNEQAFKRAAGISCCSIGVLKRFVTAVRVFFSFFWFTLDQIERGSNKLL